MKRIIGMFLLLAVVGFCGRGLYAEEVITETASPMSVVKQTTVEQAAMEQATGETPIKAEEAAKASELPAFVENQSACSAPVVYHSTAYAADATDTDASASAAVTNTCCETAAAPGCCTVPSCCATAPNCCAATCETTCWRPCCWRPLWRPCCWFRPCCWHPCWVPMCNPPAPVPMVGCGCY